MSASCVDHIVSLPRDLGDGLGVDITTAAVVCTAGVVGSLVGITGAGVVGVLWRAVVTGGILVDAGVDITTAAVVCTTGVVGSAVGITGAVVVGVLWRAVVTGGILVDSGSEDEVGVGAGLAVCSSSKHCEYQSFKLSQTNPALQQVDPFHVFPPH